MSSQTPKNGEGGYSTQSRHYSTLTALIASIEPSDGNKVEARTHNSSDYRSKCRVVSSKCRVPIYLSLSIQTYKSLNSSLPSNLSVE